MELKCIAIDDEPFALELIRQYVARIPELKLINTFDDAITGGEFLRENKTDLLFIDINMPDIDGWELLKELALFPAPVLQKCRIVLLTSSIDLFDIKKAKQIQLVNDYVTKPLSLEKLNLLIAEDHQPFSLSKQAIYAN
jgi:response regulator of citrate/malate metabolism